MTISHSAIVHHWSSCHWLISVLIMSSGFVHVLAYCRIFFIKAQYYFIVCICHILFIHSSTGKRLGCFHDLTTVNIATMNMGVLLSPQNPGFDSSGLVPRFVGSTMCVYWGAPTPPSTEAALCIHTPLHKAPCLHILHATLRSSLPGRGDVVSTTWRGGGHETCDRWDHENPRLGCPPHPDMSRQRPSHHLFLIYKMLLTVCSS